MRKVALLLLLAGLALPVRALADPAGTVTRLRGEATAEAAGKSRTLSVAAPVEVGDRLLTGPGARLELTLADGTLLTLGEKADFTIDALSIGADSGEALFSRAAGAMRLVAGDIAKKMDHRIEVASAVGTIGIRGTDVWGGSLKSPLDVFLIEGIVEVRSPAGTVVLDKPGLGTSIYGAGQAPEAPHQWSPQLRDQAIATVSFDSP